jgi:phosphate acetyltransferase
MQHPFIQHLIEQARSIHGRVAIPDAQFDERVMYAASEVHRLGWLDVVLVGSRSACNSTADRRGVDIEGIELIDADELPEFSGFCDEYGRIRAKEGLTDEQVETTMRDPAYLACMLHRKGVVDAVCSGVHYSTSDIARPAIKILGMRSGVSTMTAVSVAAFEHTPIGDNLVFVTADATILPTPDARQLAEIAILAADAAKALLPDEPRVAMLSFSTMGSAKHAAVDKVVHALQLVRDSRPDIRIDGEFQIDTAILPHVAAKKVKRASDVAGRANVLIWPSLEAGNIAMKSLMMMGGGTLVGATFLGLNGLVGDHSRGATTEELVPYIAFVGAQIPVQHRTSQV